MNNQADRNHTGNILIEKLHSAARWYAIQKYSYWTQRYDQLEAQGRTRIGWSEYTEEALNIFPRYNVLKAILVEIEKFTPSDFVSLKDAKALIIACIQLTEDIFTQNPSAPTEKTIMDDERQLFINFINTLSDNELLNVNLLPFRRVLNSDETKRILSKLEDIWHIDAGKFWYPENDNRVETFQAKALIEEVREATVKKILSEHYIKRVWQLNEVKPAYEMDCSLLSLYYNGSESYCCSENYDWIVFVSHEDSISIGGWLLNDVKSVWQNWNNKLWKP